MNGLSEAELAARAGTTPQRVHELVQWGILIPRDTELEPFELADIQRVRIAEALDAAGVPLESIGRAIAAGKLTFAFVGAIWPDPVGFVPGKSMEEVAAESGLPFELVRRGREAMGLPRTDPRDPARDDDAEMVRVAGAAVAAGFPESEVARHSRLLGEALRRIAESQVWQFHTAIEEPMLRSGLPERQIIDMAAQLGPSLLPLTERLLLLLYRRHLEHYIVDDLIEHVERALEETGAERRSPARLPAIAFCDLTGYTRLTEERGDEAAAELAALLADVTQETAHAHGGKPVKLLGDGVMLHFADPAAAVRSCLELVERVPASGLPPAHIGIHAGPVVFREGDYFGRTTNLASRVADRAGPGEVLVTEQVVREAGEADAAFEDVGAVELKGVSRPLELFRARPLGSG